MFNCPYNKMTKKLKMLLFKMSGIEKGPRITFHFCMQYNENTIIFDVFKIYIVIRRNSNTFSNTLQTLCCYYV